MLALGAPTRTLTLQNREKSLLGNGGQKRDEGLRAPGEQGSGAGSPLLYATSDLPMGRGPSGWEGGSSGGAGALTCRAPGCRSPRRSRSSCPEARCTRCAAPRPGWTPGARAATASPAAVALAASASSCSCSCSSRRRSGCAGAGSDACAPASLARPPAGQRRQPRSAPPPAARRSSAPAEAAPPGPAGARSARPAAPAPAPRLPGVLAPPATATGPFRAEPESAELGETWGTSGLPARPEQEPRAGQDLWVDAVSFLRPASNWGKFLASFRAQAPFLRHREYVLFWDSTEREKQKAWQDVCEMEIGRN